MIWTPESWHKEDWPNFSFDEMSCHHCGENGMHILLMDILQQIRRTSGPLIVTSGFRCELHPVETAKNQPGSHTFGKAVDLAVRGSKALEVLTLGIEYGMQGFGISQTGDSRFVHLDTMNSNDDGGRFPRPTIWIY